MIPDTLEALAVSLDDLVPYDGNPRQGDVGSIVTSLQANGQYRPIVVNRRGNVILAGNHTYRAALELGWDRIAATFVDVDEVTARRIVLVDNRANDLAAYDEQALAGLLQAIVDEQGPDGLLGTGFDADALDELLSDLDGGGGAGLNDPDDVPEPPADPVTQAGDLWLLGPHRLLCGDATVAANVAQLLGTEGIDLILTDPPYCSGGFQESGRSRGSVGRSAAHKQIANDRLSTRGYIALLKSAFAVAPAAYIYAFTDWRMWVYLFDVVESSGFGVRSMIVWDKGTPGMGRGWRSQHELIMWGAKQTPPFDKHASGGGNVVAAGRTGNDLHTTQKPVDLLEELLRNTPFARAIYDPFGGSGTTLIAAERLGRSARLVELDPAYCDVICRRYQAHTGTLPVREADGEPHDFTA